MKAEVGKTYAVIVGGAVNEIFTKDIMPEWHDGLPVVDITNVSPLPDVGWEYDGVSFSNPSSALSLMDYKTLRASDVDSAAGAARKRYITVVAGQEAVYLTKGDEAKAYIDAGYTGSVPVHIQAIATAVGRTPTQIADEIMARKTLWLETLSPQIEAHRVSGKEAIESAANEAGVDLAADKAINALNLI